jgi:hypothetical protein
MKSIAIFLMLLGILLILSYGFLYLLGFAMSFDAADGGGAKAWLLRFLMVWPLLILIFVLNFAWRAFQSGQYKRSVNFGFVFAVSGIGFFIYLYFMFL